LSTAGLVEQGYEPYAADVTRGEAYVPQDASQQLVREYANGNYGAVVKNFGQHPSRSPQEVLIAANAYLALSQPAQAIPLLQRVVTEGNASGNRTAAQDAEYYLAWAYLKNNQLPEAERLFSAIRQTPDHKYHPDVDRSLYWNIKLLRFKHSL
jgi:TolA-binding protein